MDDPRIAPSVSSTTIGAEQVAALTQAKRPRTPLAGPYGHPFHPILVTVPIGAWVASLVFDVAALSSSTNEAAFAQGAYWLIGIGIVGALVAAGAGLMDLFQIERGTRALAIAVTHMALNLAVLAMFVADFLVRRADGYEQASATGFVLSLIAVVLLATSGWLGGMLAYHFGVRVADEQHQIKGFQ